MELTFTKYRGSKWLNVENVDFCVNREKGNSKKRGKIQKKDKIFIFGFSLVEWMKNRCSTKDTPHSSFFIVDAVQKMSD